jgi:micrococcal nuclease
MAQVDQDDLQPYDRYDRLLGKVICNGKILNAELLENNHAWISSQYCSTSEFSGEAWVQKYGCKTKTQELKQQIPKESQTPTTNENRCDTSYPDVCIPPYPPDLDCGDIPYKNFRVLSPDPHGFDRDKDGIGCES